MRQPNILFHPNIVLIAGCLIAISVFGPRSTFGLFLEPITATRGWGRDVFALAMAIQQLLWGLLQPFGGIISDRLGIWWALFIGAIFYGLGIVAMSAATTPALFYVSGGLLIGIGLAGVGLPVVVSAVGRLTPAHRRSWALGIVTAGGSVGQFLLVPIGHELLATFGWTTALCLLAIPVLLIPIYAIPLSSKAIPLDEVKIDIRLRDALSAAFAHRSYVLLLSGFFVCGFHVSFITVHLPAYLADVEISAASAAWALSLIGLFNIVGSFIAGGLGQSYSKRQLLTLLYVLRGFVILAFVLSTKTNDTVFLFAAAMGLLWLSTVPLTSGLVAVMFGTRYLSTLFGFVFLSHQVGAFVGIWLGGFLFEVHGSYQPVWILAVVLSFLAAAIHWPIKEQAVPLFFRPSET